MIQVETKVAPDVAEQLSTPILRYGWGHATLQTWFITATNKVFNLKGSKLLFVLTCEPTAEPLKTLMTYPTVGDVIVDTDSLKLKIVGVNWY